MAPAPVPSQAPQATSSASRRRPQNQIPSSVLAELPAQPRTSARFGPRSCTRTQARCVCSVPPQGLCTAVPAARRGGGAHRGRKRGPPWCTWIAECGARGPTRAPRGRRTPAWRVQRRLSTSTANGDAAGPCPSAPRAGRPSRTLEGQLLPAACRTPRRPNAAGAAPWAPLRPSAAATPTSMPRRPWAPPGGAPAGTWPRTGRIHPSLATPGAHTPAFPPLRAEVSGGPSAPPCHLWNPLCPAGTGPPGPASSNCCGSGRRVNWHLIDY